MGMRMGIGRLMGVGVRVWVWVWESNLFCYLNRYGGLCLFQLDNRCWLVQGRGGW